MENLYEYSNEVARFFEKRTFVFSVFLAKLLK